MSRKTQKDEDSATLVVNGLFCAAFCGDNAAIGEILDRLDDPADVGAKTIVEDVFDRIEAERAKRRST